MDELDKRLIGAYLAMLDADIREEAAHILDGEVMEPPMEYHKPEDGYVLPPGMVMQTHPRERCVGNFCSVHNPSAHPLRDAPRNWRSDKGMMERQCVHGVGHPDPDDLAFFRRTRDAERADGRGVHGCCIERCCVDFLEGEAVSQRQEIEG